MSGHADHRACTNYIVVCKCNTIGNLKRGPVRCLLVVVVTTKVLRIHNGKQ